MTVQELPVRDIVAGDNERKVFPEGPLRGLAENIRAHGLVQPITVRPLWLCSICGYRESENEAALDRCPTCESREVDLVYEVVAGKRRLRAVAMLGWETVPAIERLLDNEQAASIVLAKHLARADLSPIEEAQAYARRIGEFGWSVEILAKITGVKVDTVSSRLSLLELTQNNQ